MTVQKHNPLPELQKAIYTRLSTAMSPIPVLDYVPEDEPAAYVLIDEQEAEDISTYSYELWECGQRLQAVSRAKGKQQAHTLLQAAISAVTDDAHPLTVSGWTVYGGEIAPDSPTVGRDEDGVTYLGEVWLRMTLQKT